MQDIIQFEQHRRLRLPDEFKQYLCIANGMAQKPPKDVDEDGYSFWPLERMTDAQEEFSNTSNHAKIPLNSALRDYLIFADYMQWSWTFAIKTTNHESATTPVYRVDSPDHVHKIAESFHDFLNMYVNDAERLYTIG